MSSGSRIRVLVVDDDPPVRTSLVGYLEDFDFEVAGAGSGEEALALWEQGSFDVAVIDMRLPGMNGEALVLRLHAISPETHFLISTGSLDYEIGPELAVAGVRQEHVFSKPITDLSAMVACIRGLRGG